MIKSMKQGFGFVIGAILGVEVVRAIYHMVSDHSGDTNDSKTKDHENDSN